MQRDTRPCGHTKALVFSFLCVLCALCGSPLSAAEPKKVTYADHVLPILRDRCLGCHGADKKKGGLAVPTFTDLMQGGSSGSVVKPGDPDGSRLFLLMAHKAEPVMPPKAPKLEQAKLDLMRQMAPGASGILIDAYYGAWPAIATEAMPPEKGLLVRVEKSGSTIYWYSASEVLDETNMAGSVTNSSFNEYIFFGGNRIARRDSSNNVFYYLTDQIGSSRVIADVPSGQTTATMCYDADFEPFGGEHAYTNSCSQNYKFTGIKFQIDAAQGLHIDLSHVVDLGHRLGRKDDLRRCRRRS